MLPRDGAREQTTLCISVPHAPLQKCWGKSNLDAGLHSRDVTNLVISLTPKLVLLRQGLDCETTQSAFEFTV